MILNVILGELCLMSCILGVNRDIFFPKLSENLHLTTFSDIAVKYLEGKGLEPVICKSEQEARDFAKTLVNDNKWPCLFTASDTTGEKDFEEFFTDMETLEMNKFESIGVIKNKLSYNNEKLALFEKTIIDLKENKKWNKDQINNLFLKMIPDFDHKETGKYLDSKM